MKHEKTSREKFNEAAGMLTTVVTAWVFVFVFLIWDFRLGLGVAVFTYGFLLFGLAYFRYKKEKKEEENIVKEIAKEQG